MVRGAGNTSAQAVRGIAWGAVVLPFRAMRGLVRCLKKLFRLGILGLPRWVKLAAAAVFAALIVGVLSSGYSHAPFPGTVRPDPVDQANLGALKREVSRLRIEQKALQAKLARKVPGGFYVVIDQTHNRLYLKKKNEIVLEAVCSAGSGMVLRESAEGGREWVFDTPRGSFKVLSKSQNPAWRKPDWAFVEEGLPIPDDPSERIEYGVLGEYALYFGNGYMIHGTLYERLLGRSVTHGCIRLGQEDLEKVNAACPVGTRIYIF